MKLTRQLSLWISLGICLVLALNAWLRVDSDHRYYRHDVALDHDATGRSLATAVELLWRTDGELRARELIEALDLRATHAQIRWVWADGDPPEDAPVRADLVPDHEEPTRSIVLPTPDGTARVLSYTGVDLPIARRGGIEIDELLADEAQHMQHSLIRAATTTALLVLLCVGMTLGFGMVFVARPLRLLADKARRIGEGDLSGPVETHQDDEIRDVARAMNEMCERLAEARTRLEAETAAKVRAIEQLRHADRLRTVGQLASMIAHELGTPLNVVRARGSMIAQGELPADRVRELGDVIVEQSDRMAGIIRSLLDVARRDPPDRYRADLVAPVRDAVRWLGPVARKRDVTVDLRGADDAAPVEVAACIDPRQVQQAVTNLIINAVQASPPGGRVLVRVTGTPDEGRVEVIDHGSGIAEEHLGQLFEPFFTTKGVSEGTGLGLAVTEEIVREHGGVIEVESELGRGSTFRIRLPRDRDVRIEPGASAPARQESPRPAPSAARQSWRRASPDDEL